MSNLAGQEFYALKSWQVAEFHEAEDGEGDPSQVHLIFQMEDPAPWFVARFKSREELDKLIVALMAHSKRVWP